MRGKRKEERGYKLVGYELLSEEREESNWNYDDDSQSGVQGQDKQADIFKSLWDESIVGNLVILNKMLNRPLQELWMHTFPPTQYCLKNILVVLFVFSNLWKAWGVTMCVQSSAH